MLLLLLLQYKADSLQSGKKQASLLLMLFCSNDNLNKLAPISSITLTYSQMYDRKGFRAGNHLPKLLPVNVCID